MNLESKLRNSRVVIITHTFATGPGQELETFLRAKVKRLIFIGHPLPFCKDLTSLYKEYNCNQLHKPKAKYNQKGVLTKEKHSSSRHWPVKLIYFKDIFYTFWWLAFVTKNDLIVAADNLNAFCGLVLKKAGKTKKVVFYTIDYVPHRFDNPILNRIYHFLDSFCVRHCDYVWNLSSVMALEREKKGIEKKYRSKQITVPIGTNLDVERLPFEKINRYEIAFMGHLREGQGVEFLIESMPEILKIIPQAKLVLIGTGHLEQGLKDRSKKLGIFDRVEFTGFIESHAQMQNRLARCAMAVAPYIDDDKNYTRYTDPGKPKAYLASGLPVVITDIIPVAKEIERAECGVAIRFNKGEFIRAVVNLLDDEKKLKRYRENAIKFAQNFQWDKIFTHALMEVI